MPRGRTANISTDINHDDCTVEYILQAHEQTYYIDLHERAVVNIRGLLPDTPSEYICNTRGYHHHSWIADLAPTNITVCCH